MNSLKTINFMKNTYLIKLFVLPCKIINKAKTFKFIFAAPKIYSMPVVNAKTWIIYAWKYISTTVIIHNIFLLSLQIEFGLFKHFSMQWINFIWRYSREKLTHVSDGKIKEGIFVGLQIRYQIIYWNMNKFYSNLFRKS